jgi:hypothetical protein
LQEESANVHASFTKGSKTMIEHLPDPYPDEILYSIWARYSDQVRYPYKADVLQELFGNRNVKPSVDLPGHLQYFVEHLPHGHGYSLDFFLEHHTLLPFYRPFLSQERLNCVREHMVKGDRPSHFVAGVTGGRLLSPLWLRYCPLCAMEERTQFGECYWHRFHQVLGVELCPIHHVFLENSMTRARSSLAELGLVSAEQAIKLGEPREASASPFFHVFMDIACETQYLLEHLIDPLDLRFLHQQYRALLTQRGFMTPKGRVRFRDILNAFTEHYSEDLLTTLQCTVRLQGPLDSEWLSRIMRLYSPEERKIVCHPLYHILAIRFLGETLETFLSQEMTPPRPFGEGPWPCLNPVCVHYLQRTISAYQLAETNVKGQMVGIFACACGYTYSRTGPDASPSDAFRKARTRIYGSVWDKKLRALWFDGTIHHKDIARLFQVNRYTINRQAKRLNLPVPRWNARPKVGGRRPKKKPKGLSRYRAQWLTVVEEAPGESRGELRSRAHGVYSWLRRHDHEWLEAHCPPKKRPGKPTQMINQEQKKLLTRRGVGSKNDARMAEAIRASVSRWANEPGPPKRISKRRIFREILQARWMPRPDEAPLTSQALQEVVETHETFALRRIRWVLQYYQEAHLCPTQKQFIARAHLKHILHVQSVQQALDDAMGMLSQESAQDCC